MDRIAKCDAGAVAVVLAFGNPAFRQPVIYIHGIWLPRHGVKGWTGEPHFDPHIPFWRRLLKVLVLPAIL